MTSILAPPQTQFIDANGAPLVGAKIYSYVPGTLSVKKTYQTANQSVENQNPVITNAAGRVTMLGEGSYRLIIKTADDVLVYDGLTSAYLDETAISPIMLPVTSAATLATARTRMGIDDAISAAIEGISLLPGPVGPQGPQGSQGPAGPQGDAATSYFPSLVGDNPGYATFPHAGGTAANIFLQFGLAYTDGPGNATVIFAKPYPNKCLSVVVSCTSASWWAAMTGYNQSGFTAVTSSPLKGGNWLGGPIGVSWFSIGW